MIADRRNLFEYFFQSLFKNHWYDFNCASFRLDGAMRGFDFPKRFVEEKVGMRFF